MESSSKGPRSAHDPWLRLSQECAHGAIYDSNERQPHSQCLEGTRVDLLQHLKDLVDDGRRKVVWVSGESGSGKSTVAHTLADGLRAEGKLVGTFFFSRKHTKRSTFNYVLLTLAYQIGLHHPIARETIVKAISDDPALLSPDKSRHDLLVKLIMEPMRELAIIWKDTPDMSIVFDALDEGANSGTDLIRPFILLLARLVKDASLPVLNIIITSRPWPEIRAVMGNPNVSPVLETVLVERFDSHEDVVRFLRHSFDHVYDTCLRAFSIPGPWPPEVDFQILSEQAHGRFIFAATVIRFIGQDEPQSRLRLICSMLRRNTSQDMGDVHHLYSSIIDEVDPLTRAKGMKYLSLIINLAEPLAISDLDQLFGDHVHSYLIPFSALISVPPPGSPGPVEVFHSSLRDFLQQKEHDDVTAIHNRLALSCFQTMRALLKRDICGLNDPSLLHDEIPDFAQKRDSIPRALRYACLYWLHHVQLTQPTNEIQGHLFDFLRHCVLFSIEAYAVIGELRRGITIFYEARGLVADWPGGSFAQKDDTVALLHDSWRLTLTFFDAISISALHVYESALPFSPKNSKIRQVYSHYFETETAFIFEEGLDDEWGCFMHKINTETWSLKVAMSPDTSQIAAITEDSVRVWNTATGVLVASLPFSTSNLGIRDIMHNGSLVAFPGHVLGDTSDTPVCLVWRPSDGEVFSFCTNRPPTGLLKDRTRIALPSNGDTVACFSVDKDGLFPLIEVFEVATKELLSYIQLH
ncbi:hypothetical protein CONPUDRAFT_113946, partial [Coniophora puteana RWD-64-598 SS2]